MDETKIKLILRKFSKKRNWDQFHTLRNLATALSVEASELLEIFQWFNEDKTKKIDKNLKNKISEEVADIMLYLIRFSDIAKINIEEECLKKIKKNKKKYPIKLSKGISKKYNEL
ncbi:MAG: nucleotide pyrophosphohydrolase [Rickettsiales bacterium TMED254]|nr:nucleotide pyrophosphohydrolase [Rickettsiales bacterium]RPF76323.1 MAG: nucleotide pyrophosphohydrolase [Rickettsiales bacterium TMED254]|tara:strand:- start:313 stop:657 length:345 start_codon:yes stop_codon:yes gene_type:complete